MNQNGDGEGQGGYAKVMPVEYHFNIGLNDDVVRCSIILNKLLWPPKVASPSAIKQQDEAKKSKQNIFFY